MNDKYCNDASWRIEHLTYLVTLILGMKTLVWSITFVNAPPQAGQASGVVNSNGPKGMREDEASIAIRIKFIVKT